MEFINTPPIKDVLKDYVKSFVLFGSRLHEEGIAEEIGKHTDLLYEFVELSIRSAVEKERLKAFESAGRGMGVVIDSMNSTQHDCSNCSDNCECLCHRSNGIIESESI